MKTGKPAEAEAEYRKALAIRQKLADDNPADTYFRSRLAASHINLGVLLSTTGKPAEAEAECRKGLAIRQKLVDDNPSVIGFRGGLSDDYLRVAALHAWFGQDKELSSTCEKLLSLAKDTEDPLLADKAAKCCSLHRPTPGGAKPRWSSPVARWNMERVPSGWFISRWPSAWQNTEADTSRKPTPL